MTDIKIKPKTSKRKSMPALEKNAHAMGVNFETLNLKMGENKREWECKSNGKYAWIETATLDNFECNGWHGYSHEGGLLLNLIKAMSFPEISLRHRCIYIESIYSQNVSFEEDRFELQWLLKNVESANVEQIKRNFQIMISDEEFFWKLGNCSFVKKESVLEPFPYLEESLLVGLYENLGNEKILEIANIFSTDPYEFRRGWPDLVIWKDGKVRFIEVKAPGDRLQASQKAIIENFIIPLKLDFTLLSVQPEKNNI